MFQGIANRGFMTSKTYLMTALLGLLSASPALAQEAIIRRLA